jgi:hypothetical protein
MEVHDRGIEIPLTGARHLEECPACRHFSQFLLTVGPRLKDELDERIASSPRPDMQKLFNVWNARMKKRRIYYACGSIAAALIISISSFAGVSIVKNVEAKNLVTEETHYFVDDLFNTPLFEGIEYLTVDE